MTMQRIFAVILVVTAMALVLATVLSIPGVATDTEFSWSPAIVTPNVTSLDAPEEPEAPEGIQPEQTPAGDCNINGTGRTLLNPDGTEFKIYRSEKNAQGQVIGYDGIVIEYFKDCAWNLIQSVWQSEYIAGTAPLVPRYSDEDFGVIAQLTMTPEAAQTLTALPSQQTMTPTPRVTPSPTATEE